MHPRRAWGAHPCEGARQSKDSLHAWSGRGLGCDDLTDTLNAGVPPPAKAAPSPVEGGAPLALENAIAVDACLYPHISANGGGTVGVSRATWSDVTSPNTACESAAEPEVTLEPALRRWARRGRGGGEAAASGVAETSGPAEARGDEEREEEGPGLAGSGDEA